MTEKVEREIKTANAFGDEIERLVVARGGFPSGERNSLLMGYWSLAFEVHRAILCLLSHKFYGAAFALVRPLVEATVRAHVAIMGSDEVVIKLSNDEYRTNLATIGAEIDADFHTGELFQNFLKGARESLHGYTHMGMHQVGRRFADGNLMANYKEGEILEVIRVSTSAVFIINNLATKYLGWEKEWEKNTDLYAEWGKHSA